jgi:PAS domain S-box-containing protein
MKSTAVDSLNTDTADHSIPKSASIGMFLSAFLLIPLGILVIWLQIHSQDTVRWVNHTEEVRLHLAQFLSVMQDAETGQRGFLITGKENYLEPYNSAQKQIDGSVKNLRHLTADNLYQQEILNDMESLVLTKLAELDNTVAIRRDEGFDSALRVVLTDDGKQAMDKIRKLTDKMAAEEERLLEIRNESVSRNSSIVTAIMVLVVILILALITIACVMTTRNFRLLRQSQQMKHESEKRFDLAVRGTSEGIWDWNISTNKEWWSEQCFSLLGYEQDELKNENLTILQLLHAKDKAPTDKAIQAHLEDRVPYDVEFRLRTKSGNYSWFRSRGQAVWDEKGRPIRMAGSIQDISERKQAQERIAQSEKHLTDFFDNASVGLHWVSPDGTILRANQCELDLLGYTHDEYVGHKITEFHADQDVIDDILMRLVSGETLDNYPARLLSKDGSIKHVLINSNVYMENGVFTHTRCFSRDVTDRMAAENQLRTSEAKLKAILETAADAIITIDTHGRIQSYNPAAEEMFGYSVQEVLQENISMLMPSPYSEYSDSYLANYMRTGEKKVIGIGREVIGLRKDGSTFPLELAVSEVQQEGMHLFTGVVRDISDRKRAENELTEYSKNLENTHSHLASQAKEVTQKAAELSVAQQELQRANKAKSEFLANMSHELRTPLNAVIGFSDGLIERSDRHPLNEHQMDRLSKINKSGQHLLSLINDVLDISKVESGKLEVHPSSFDVFVMAAEVADVAEGLCRDKSLVSFRMEIDPDLPPLTSDRERIKQVLINLVGNAIKFTEQGQIILQIRRVNDHFLMSVQDTGIGIPAKHCEKVFEKFHQIRSASTSSIKGTGLGLSICKAFADLIGATLSVESVLGTGSTFSLSVPERFFVDDRSHSEILHKNPVIS